MDGLVISWHTCCIFTAPGIWLLYWTIESRIVIRFCVKTQVSFGWDISPHEEKSSSSFWKFSSAISWSTVVKAFFILLRHYEKEVKTKNSSYGLHTSLRTSKRLRLSPVSVAWSDEKYFYSPLSRIPVHRRVTPRIKLASTHLFTWWRGAAWKKSVLPRNIRQWTGQDSKPDCLFCVQRANHKTTTPPFKKSWYSKKILLVKIHQPAEKQNLQQQPAEKSRTFYYTSDWAVFSWSSYLLELP